MIEYSYVVFWSDADREYAATCMEVPVLSGLGATEALAIQELKVAMTAWFEYLESQGLPRPAPLWGATVTAIGKNVTLATLPAVSATTAGHAHPAEVLSPPDAR